MGGVGIGIHPPKCASFPPVAGWTPDPQPQDRALQPSAGGGGGVPGGGDHRHATGLPPGRGRVAGQVPADAPPSLHGAPPPPDVVLACEAVPGISVPNPCPGPSEPCFERNPALPSGLMVAVCGRYGLRGIVRRWRLDTRIGKVRDPPSAATPLPPTPTSLCLAVPTEKFAQKSHYYHFRVKSGPKMDIFGSDHNHRQERVLWVACVLGIVPPHHAFFFA